MNKTAAWKFIEFLISDEMQTSPDLGLPINKSAFKEKFTIETKQFCQDESISLPKNTKIELRRNMLPLMSQWLIILRHVPIQIPK